MFKKLKGFKRFKSAGMELSIGRTKHAEREKVDKFAD